ncbi:YveK family protein [Pisciglobus halotolerans]|uniref:Capsular polysaccharide biosynthesis protein CpsC n=1 Tax=Pisciglobus halotolerans TaxID=745365 RepID=A0A1I3DJF4_9LACT|nr:Wzz/FepE/Etk N-terminal domain-containing protein [Pisciglobus halotolerans]SFH86826.1 Capsular polysaccharide biosynthesis protein [Pisciglobus halotolerans]
MEEEISLVELFEILKKRASLIISLGLVGLILASIFTFFIATPQYSSTTQLLVNKSSDDAQGVQLSDINTNVQMINTYRDIIKGPVILEEVLKDNKLDLTVSELSDKITIETQDNSQVFSLKVSDESPYQAAEIANATAGIFQEKIGDIMKIENVSIISSAEPSDNPVSPNNMLNLIIGLLVGLMLGVGAAFLIEFMDKSINDEKFITDTLGWSNLGTVSEMSEDELEAKVESSKDMSKQQARRTRARV